MDNFEKILEKISSKITGESDYSWEELSLETGINKESLRKMSCGKYGGASVYNYFINNNDTFLSEELLSEIKKERIKLQRLNRERNETLREEADRELFDELILDAINNLPDIKVPARLDWLKTPVENCQDEAVLVVSDAHYGKSFKLVGLNGEIVNEYNTDIFKDRMNHLLDSIVDDFVNEKVKYNKLHIIDAGDCIDGVLRTGTSLRKNQVSTVDAVIEYSEFMSQWLAALRNSIGIDITYSLTGGNHDQLRLLTNKKQFDDENVAKLIHKFISLRLSGIDGIYINDYDEAIFNSVCGVNIMSYHGDSSNMSKDIEFFENFYNVNIDILIGGHLHSKSEKAIGIGSSGDRELIRVPSICGTDDYAKSIRVSARPGAKFMLFNWADGMTWNRIYYLG